MMTINRGTLTLSFLFGAAAFFFIASNVRADELTAPIHCGFAKSATDGKIILSKINVRTYDAVDASWKESKFEKAAMEIAPKKDDTESVKAIESSVQSAKQWDLRVCLQQDATSKTGYRVASGPTDDETVAELVSE